MCQSLWFIGLYLVPLFSWAQKASGKEPNFLLQMVPFILMFGIFYFLIIRPQSKKQAAHKQFVTTLKKGDRVLTSSGIYGTVEGLNDNYVILEIAEGVKIRLLRSFIAQPINEGKKQ